eukprot:54150-Prymnesium_polylepis.2
MFEKFTRCLTPQRSGPAPQRAVYLIGDSHANSLSEGVDVNVPFAPLVCIRSWVHPECTP